MKSSKKVVIGTVFLALIMLGAGCSYNTENKSGSAGINLPNDFIKVKTWNTATLPDTKVKFAYLPIENNDFEVKVEKNGPGMGASAVIKDDKKTLMQAEKTPDILSEFCAYPNFYITVDTTTKKYSNLKDYISDFYSNPENQSGAEEAGEYGIYTTINNKEVFIERSEGPSKRLFMGSMLTADGIVNVVMGLSSVCAYPGYILSDRLVATPEVSNMVTQFEQSNYYSFLDILKGIASLN